MDNNFENLEETNIFSAKVARAMTDKARDEDMSCLKPIMEKIQKNARMKDYHCYISATTPDYILEKLRRLGYVVQLIKGDPRDPRETDTIKISWK